MSDPVEDYLPPVDELTQPWWDATREGRLLIQQCGTCQHLQHYPRYLCTACGATDALGWVEAQGTGTIDTFTIVHRAPRSGVDVPYVVARVRLTEGPILLTNVVGAAPEQVASGADVTVSWRSLSDGRQLPVFAPAEPSIHP